MEKFKTMELAREEYNEENYVILTDSEADKKCKEYIKIKKESVILSYIRLKA